MALQVYKSFENRYRKLLGEEYPKLLKVMEEGVRQCIRVNTFKANAESLKESLSNWNFEQVPWYNNAFFVCSANISKTIQHSLGYYFIQDASSLIPPLVLNPEEYEKVLDMCAAPGSKTTFLAELMKNKGMIVANDVNAKRLKALSCNLQRIFVSNTIVTNYDGRMLFKKGWKFDKILLDAPCSGSGTIASSASSLLFWSESILSKLSSVQKDLLTSADKMLEDGGTIVYSTCSMDPEENEAIVDFAVETLGLKTEKIDMQGLVYRRGISEFEGRTFAGSEDCIRFYPFDNRTEGFFVCKLRK